MCYVDSLIDFSWGEAVIFFAMLQCSEPPMSPSFNFASHVTLKHSKKQKNIRRVRSLTTVNSTTQKQSK